MAECSSGFLQKLSTKSSDIHLGHAFLNLDGRFEFANSDFGIQIYMFNK